VFIKSLNIGYLWVALTVNVAGKNKITGYESIFGSDS